MPIPTNPSPLSASDLVYIGAVVGAVAAIVGSLIQFIISGLARAAEERRHIRDIAIKLALEQWRHDHGTTGHFERIESASTGSRIRDIKATTSEMLRFVESISK